MRCEACKRNHTASFVVTLSGVPYDSEALWAGTLAPLEYLAVERPRSQESTAEEDSSDHASFQLGSHCYKRANLFHQLAHYKAALIGLIHVCASSLPATPPFCLHIHGNTSDTWTETNRVCGETDAEHGRRGADCEHTS